MRYRKKAEDLEVKDLFICVVIIPLQIPERGVLRNAVKTEIQIAKKRGENYIGVFSGMRMMETKKKIVPCGFSTLFIQSKDPLGKFVLAEKISKENLYMLMKTRDFLFQRGIKP